MKYNRRVRGNSERPITFGNSIPKSVQRLARNNPILRVKNVHKELNGEDLSKLFEGISPVEFVKFDPANENIAFVCFRFNHSKNNSLAISKFDGRKAMGQTLVVENATSLADRIDIPPMQSRNAGVNKRQARQAKKNKGKPKAKSVDDLDQELSAYMSGNSTENPENSNERERHEGSNTNLIADAQHVENNEDNGDNDEMKLD